MVPFTRAKFLNLKVMAYWCIYMVEDLWHNHQNHMRFVIKPFSKHPLILPILSQDVRAPVAQLVEHWAVMREVVSSTLAGPTLRVVK